MDLRRDACPALYRLQPTQDEMCKTKPIYARPVGRANPETNHAKRTQFLPPGPIVRNKANSRQCRVGRGPGYEGRGGQSCKTKPIWPPVSGNGRAPAGPGASAEGRLCKTKPICLGRAGETTTKAAGLDAATRPVGQLRETKPISGSAGWDKAAGVWGAGRMCKTKPIWWECRV
jgi:hypothetical protein